MGYATATHLLLPWRTTSDDKCQNRPTTPHYNTRVTRTHSSSPSSSPGTHLLHYAATLVPEDERELRGQLPVVERGVRLAHAHRLYLDAHLALARVGEGHTLYRERRGLFPHHHGEAVHGHCVCVRACVRVYVVVGCLAWGGRRLVNTGYGARVLDRVRESFGFRRFFPFCAHHFVISHSVAPPSPSIPTLHVFDHLSP